MLIPKLAATLGCNIMLLNLAAMRARVYDEGVSVDFREIQI